MLFNKDWNEWEVNKPELLPSYNNERLNAYRYGEGIKDFNTDAYCFAQSLIQKIDRSPGQEIGTHTYSHYYCKEAGQSKDMFRADLVRAIKLAEKLGVKLRSIVFPRNQFKEDYIQICMDLGIDSFRSNPDSWYWKNPESNSILHKIFRTGEAYLGNNDKSYSLISTKSGNGKTFQKASRMFRPPSVYNKLEKLKISRIKSEIEKAAKNSEIYHLWWHPHNFGDNPSLCLNQLTEILESYSDAKKKYGFESLSMSEITDLANYN